MKNVFFLYMYTDKSRAHVWFSGRYEETPPCLPFRAVHLRSVPLMISVVTNPLTIVTANLDGLFDGMGVCVKNSEEGQLILIVGCTTPWAGVLDGMKREGLERWFRGHGSEVKCVCIVLRHFS